MSLNHKRLRKLRLEEKALVLSMLENHPLREEISKQVEDVLVIDLEDDGMGSVRVYFDKSSEEQSAIPLANAMYRDADDIQISVQLNVNKFGKLSEIDIWKTDFSPTITYPTATTKITL